MELRVKPFAAEEIRGARDKANLTQVELAALLGVSPRTVQNWEAGRGNSPRAKHRRRLLEFLDNGKVAA